MGARYIQVALVFIVGLQALAACSPPQPPPLREVFLEATRDLQGQRFETALGRIEKAEARLRTQTSGLWFWKFRLLKAEVLLGMREANDEELAFEIEALLGDPAPAPELEVRRLRLKWLETGNPSFLRRAYRQAAAIDDRNQLTELEYYLARLEDNNGTSLEVLLPLQDRDLKGIDPYHLARSSINIGHYYKVARRFGLARDWAERGLEHSRRADFELGVLFSLVNLSTAQNLLGHFDAAKSNLDEARELALTRGHEGNLSQIYLELGNNEFWQGNFGAAVEQFRTGAERAIDPGDKAKLLHNQFVALAGLGECAQARIVRAKMRNFEPLTASAPDAGGSEETWRNTLNEGWLRHICGEYEWAENLYARVVRDARESPFLRLRAHTGLGLAAAELQRPGEANQHFEQALRLVREADDPFSLVEDRVAVFSALLDTYDEFGAILMEQGDEERALEIADSSRGALLRERLLRKTRTDGTIEGFRRMARGRDEVILLYWISEQSSQVWVLGPEGVDTIPLLVRPDELFDWIERYSRGILRGDDPDTMPNYTGFQLFEALVEPIREWTPPGARVVLVLDDELNGLNFETLPVGPRDDWHYWLDEVDLSVAPSLSQLAARSDAECPPPTSLILAGDPDYADPEDRLASAGREIDDIASHFNHLKARKLTKGSATPARLFQLLEGAPDGSWIHIAAHAVAVASRPLESAILLTPRGERSKLYASEILEIEPFDPGLVSLSACQTIGEDSYSGEGPLGLAWAFMALGACNVVASLWEVEDQATADLMDRFYEKLSDGRPIAESLALAKRELRKIGKGKPKSWGGFQHYIGCFCAE